MVDDVMWTKHASIVPSFPWATQRSGFHFWTRLVHSCCRVVINGYERSCAWRLQSALLSFFQHPSHLPFLYSRHFIHVMHGCHFFFPSPHSIFNRSFVAYSPLSLQRLISVGYNAARASPMFPPHISLVLSLAFTSQSLDRSLHLTLCVDYELWVLDRPPGVIYISHGLPRKKVGSRNFLRWAPIYVAQSRWHTAASRNLKANLRSF